jgi:hypothetical protein
VGHLRSSGFIAQITNVENLAAVKRGYGVTSALGSCHTAIVDGYVVEGHVPADVIWKLLKERPDVIGISVPDMPLGSPGMEVPGRPAESYDVLAFDREGRVSVFVSR